ncbi:Iron-sulfur cluster insertion protein ErpA [Phycisphaerae bacterium RAS1]|nr:Iron-sulfur cluster insertion protein ErpA [Phycisphaerae bacterium RAS1]
MSATSTVPSDMQPLGASESKPAVKLRAKAAAEGQGIHLTDKAAETIQNILKKDNYPDTMYLYVGVKGGGCSGLQYVLDLRDEAHAPVSDKDEVFETHGITVVCDLKSYIVGNLTGTIIDYQESMMGAGFTFNNPNAKHSCGCGSSYSA